MLDIILSYSLIDAHIYLLLKWTKIEIKVIFLK